MWWDHDVSTAPLIPRAVLFGNPTRTAPVISPDGSLLGYVAPLDGVLNVWVAPLDDLDAARPVTHEGGHGVRAFLFGEDDRTLLYLRDEDGDEDWQVHTLDLATGRNAQVPIQLPSDRLQVRGRQEGELFQPLGLGGRSLKLSDFMINRQVPRRARDGWPLLVSYETVIWVPGHRISELFAVSPDTEQIAVVRLKREAGA